MGSKLNRVAVVGPGHHERAIKGAEVIAALAGAGYEVVVKSDLRPRLADDLVSLLEAGANLAILSGSGVRAVVTHENAEFNHLEYLGPRTVIVELLAGVGPIRAEIKESDTDVDKTTIMLAIE